MESMSGARWFSKGMFSQNAWKFRFGNYFFVIFPPFGVPKLWHKMKVWEIFSRRNNCESITSSPKNPGTRRWFFHGWEASRRSRIAKATVKNLAGDPAETFAKCTKRQGSLNGTHLGVIKQCKCMVILTHVPYNNVLFGLVIWWTLKDLRLVVHDGIKPVNWLMWFQLSASGHCSWSWLVACLNQHLLGSFFLGW